MLLQQLTLENIRSYSRATMQFPAGSLLLSGDIGSGKTTILLAIEFALFGATRPDLPAEALLRKGSSTGSVELQLNIDGKDVLIKRNLKKEKDAIRQTSGYIICNSQKKELTPVELKAEVIHLLGYPEEFITKNKNYIFRYTLYTPQEEMRLILQDDPEIRLDVLRKVFNSDKYKTIRENLQLYLRQLRTQLAILKAKTEPFEEQQRKLRQVEEEKKTFQHSLQQLEPQVQEKKRELEERQLQLNQREAEQRQYEALQQEQKQAALLLAEKKNQHLLIENREQKVQQEIASISLPESFSAEQSEKELRDSEQRKNELLTTKTVCRERLLQLQKRLEEWQKEIRQQQDMVARLPEKEAQKQKIETDIVEKKILQEKKKTVEERLYQVRALLTRQQTILAQAQELQDKMRLLKTCPLCLQDVAADHKQHIIAEEEKKTQEANEQLAKATDEKQALETEKKQVEEFLETLVKKEQERGKLVAEIAQLQERKQAVQQKEQQFHAGKEEVTKLQLQLQELEQVNDTELEEEIKKKRTALELFSKKKYLKERLADYQQQKTMIQELIQELALRQETIRQTLAQKQDQAAQIREDKLHLARVLQQEKELLIERMKLATSLDRLSRQEQELQKIIAELQELKNKTLRLQELSHWLEEHFLKLTITIEKQVMLQIHRLFNQLFQEWFSLLIDDEQLSARLDDAFTPILEQNGYEISFSNLSGGERTSAALAYRLALNKVINDIIPQIKTKDLLILDEPTDGFSSEQLDKVRDVLEKLHLRQTILVSHEAKMEGFVEQVIKVVKEGQVSRIIA